MTAQQRRRGGFTLIEVITVMSIIVLLAAITAAAVGRARSSQLSRNSEATVAKLQLALDQHWKAVADQATNDRSRGKIPSQIVSGCNNDLDLAAAVWAYILTRRDFPNTFAEAKAPITGPGGYSINARNTFASVNANKPTSLTPQDEAAVLLYLMLSDKDTGGATFNADDATRGAQGTITDTKNNVTYTVFMDAWRTPISFIRYASGGLGGELNSPPFVNAGSTVSQDPLDPRGKLQGWSGKGAVTGVFPSGVAGSATSFDGKNKQPAVISAGANKSWDTMFDADNVVGYRLRRQGDRGD